MIVGEASVLVHMDTSGARSEFKTAVEGDVAAAGSDLEAAGAQAGGHVRKGLDEELKGAGNDAETAGKGIGNRLSAAMSTAGQGHPLQGIKEALGNIPVPAAVAVGAVAAVGAVVIDAGIKMQEATAKIAASGHISQGAAAQIGQAFNSTAGTVTFSGQQMATVYATVAGQLGSVAGHALNSGQALSVMKASMDLAEASGTSLSSATSDVAKVLQTFHLSVNDSAGAADVLYSVSNRTGQGVDAVTMALTKLKAGLGSNAPDIKSMGGLIVDLAQHGETGRKSITALTSGLSALAQPTTKVQQAAYLMGITLKDANGNFVGMGSVMDQLKPKLDTMNASQQTLYLSHLLGAKGAAQWQATIAAGSGTLDKYTASAAKSGSAQQAAATATATFSGAWTKVKVGIDDAAASLGAKLAPLLTTVGMKVAGFIQDVVKHWPEISHAISEGINAVKPALEVLFHILGEVFKFIIDHKPILIAVLAAIALAFFPVITAVFALLGVVSLIISHWGTIENFFKDLLGHVVGYFNEALHPIEAVFDTVKNVATTVVDWIRNHWELLLGILTGPVGLAVTMIVTHFHDIEAGVAKVLDDVIGFFTAIPGRVATAVAAIFTTGFALFTSANTWVWNNTIAPVLTLFTQLPAQVATAIAQIFNVGFAILLTAGAWIDNNVILPIVHFFGGLPGQVYGAVKFDLGALFGALTGAAGWITTNVIGPIASVFTALPGDIVSAIESAISVVGSIGKDILNGLKQGLNAAINWYDAHRPSLFGVSLLPYIQPFAAGGLVTSPTIALIGEAGPEYVIPADQVSDLSRPGAGSTSISGGGGSGTGMTIMVTVAAGAVVINPPPGTSASSMRAAVNDGFVTLGREISSGVAPIRSAT